MRQLATRQECFSYPFRPRMVLLEQPWHLSRNDWSAEDPGTARRMLGGLLEYSARAGIPVFSSHSSDFDFNEARAFRAEFNLPEADIHSITKHGYCLDDSPHRSAFLESLVSPGSGPVVVGGAHARFSGNTAFGSILTAIGLEDIRLDGLCIRHPLRFLVSLRDSGLIDAKIYLDPRLTIQLSGAKMGLSRLYEVVGMDDEESTFGIRPSMKI